MNHSLLGRFKNFVQKKKEKIVRLSFGIGLVFFISFLLFIEVEPIASWVSALENLSYDLQVRQMHKPLGTDNPIVIVDIDDKSLKEEGRWPWSRKKFADLVTNLYQNGATVVAFDIAFPEKEANIAEEVIKEVKKTPTGNVTSLEKVKEVFDYDTRLAKSLQLGESVLGMVFTNGGETSGVLPPPIAQLSPEMTAQLGIINQKKYLANIAQLQAAAKTEGFINATPDRDGVLRFSPLLFRHDSDVYGSLALQAVARYLLADKIELVSEVYADAAVLEGIRLDKLMIPTDYMGRILIPFRGLPYSFPYISATDVLKGEVSKEILNGKLVFVGATASAIGDTRAAAIAPVFPGIEVHASIASGIIDQYLPYKPSWGRGVTLLVMQVFGSIYAVLLPFLGLFSIAALCLMLPIGLIFANFWLWSNYGIVISVFLPVALILLLFVLNVVWGYLFESQKSKELKAMFGQYVPPAYLDEMLKRGEEFSLEGESKELSVLFADIRSFTSLSEKMTAGELKLFLNRYFDPMTEAIFRHKGTIDKYVGDMVMAFWGAPLNDPRHAYNAVKGGMAMQEALAKLNETLVKENKPEVKNGVGVNTGIMNVGDMGSKFRKAYTVLGDTVNLASRLEGQTKFYRIGMLVGEITYAETKDDFAYRKVDKIKVKGKDTGVEVFCPICETKDITPEIKEELNIHHQALDTYFHQKWDEAEAAFKKLAEKYPKNHGLYEVYVERIDFYRKEPPGPNWDGSYVSHEK
jgi:adenylate cyclase